MLRSHRILCSCVPVPVFLRRCYTLALPFAVPVPLFILHLCMPARSSHNYLISTPACISAARSLFPRTTTHCTRLLVFPLPVRPLAVSRKTTPARISAVRSLFPRTTTHCACPLAVPAHSRPLAFPLRARCFLHARSTPLHARSLFAQLLDFHACLHFRCTLAVPPHDHSLRTPARISTSRMPARCFPQDHARSHFRCALAVPPHDHSLRTPARCSRTLTPARISTACSLFPACPFAARLLAISRAPLPPPPCASSSALCFLLRLALPPLPHASSSALCFLLRLALPPRLAWLGFAALGFASPAKPSQAPNTLKQIIG
ncbi:hypothetical protein B0H13DRAFT_2336132 [Mycena leptocephala]|nr:hypothetical protein B0H13DRAFT_2336132 [Mycena leptocephala]